jgi:hypothetical protein
LSIQYPTEPSSIQAQIELEYEESEPIRKDLCRFGWFAVLVETKRHTSATRPRTVLHESPRRPPRRRIMSSLRG